MIPQFNVVLVEPEIPANTGNIARTCLATAAILHLVKPLGFSLDERNLRRAGMDYWERVDVRLWNSFHEIVQAAEPGSGFHYFSTKAVRSHFEANFSTGDYLVFGRETRGLPESLIAASPDRVVRIPMVAQSRSLNLAVSAGVALYEAIRQNLGPSG